MPRRLVAAAGALALCLPLTACGEDEPDLVIYNAQHEELIDEVAEGLRGEDRHRGRAAQRLGPRAGQPARRGGRQPRRPTCSSPRTPRRCRWSQPRACFAPLDRATLDQIPDAVPPRRRQLDRLRGPLDRARLQHRPGAGQAELPASILDLAEPEWKGRISFSPDRRRLPGDRQRGARRSRARRPPGSGSRGSRRTATVYDGNNVVLESVNAGEVETGVIYHYYWYRDQEESGENSDDSQLHFFGDQDPGAFVSVSGAGVLAAGEHQEDAQEFVDYLASAEGQQVHRRQLRAGVPAQPRGRPRPRRQAARRARAAGTSTSPTSTAPRSSS